MSRPSREALLAGAVVAAGAALRAAGAILRRPWHDEYFTAYVASLPWRDLVAALRLDSGPPLSYALAKLVAACGLPELAAARLVSVAAGTLAVMLAVRAARRAFGDEAALWCGTLLAFHPLALAWSCEGRAYALLLLAVAWAWERLEALAAGERGALGLASAVALGCWSHAFGLILAAVLAVVALTAPARARRTALLAIAAGTASNLPWLPVATSQPPAAVAWMAHAFRALPIGDRILAPVRLLPPVAPFGAQLDLPSAPPLAQLAGAALCLVLLARASTAPRPLLLLVLPASGLAGLAWLGAPALYPGRGEALFLIPFLALLARGAAGVGWRRAAAALLAGAGAAVAVAALASWARSAPSGEARLARAVLQRLPEGGTVVVGGYWRLGLANHLGPERRRFLLVNLPAEAGRHPGWYDPLIDRPAPRELEDLSESLRNQAARAAIVVAPGLDTAAGLRALAALLGLRPALAVPGGELYLPPAQRASMTR